MPYILNDEPRGMTKAHFEAYDINFMNISIGIPENLLGLDTAPKTRINGFWQFDRQWNHEISKLLQMLKSTIPNNFCSTTLRFFASLILCDLSCIYYKCSISDN